MRVHDALGLRRRARGEEDGRRIGRRDPIGQEVGPRCGKALSAGMERGAVDALPHGRPLHPDHVAKGRENDPSGERHRSREPGRDLLERREVVMAEEGAHRYEKCNVGVPEEVRELARAAERIHGHEERAAPPYRERRRHPLRPVWHEEPDASSLPHPARRERPPDRHGLGRELRIGHPPPG